MKKIINQPFFIRYLMTLALLLMPLGIFAQDNIIFPYLRFINPNVQSQMSTVTEWTMNWSERSGTYPVLANDFGVDVVYSSSDTGVATIDKNGKIQPVAPGTTIISASFEGIEGIYESDYAEYKLIYTDDRYTVEDLGLHFSLSTASAIYGDATVNTPSLETDKMPQDASYTYSSSVPSVATVDAAGRVTIVGAETTVISASYAGNENVKPGSVSYTLIVAKKEVGLEWGTTTFTYDGSAHVPTATATGLVGSDVCNVTVDGAQTNAGSNYTATATGLSNANYKLPAATTTIFTISKAEASVTFASKTEDAKMGENYAGQTATTIPSGLTLTYSSSATSVATVNESTGAVTLVAVGSTTIKATFAGNDNYNSASDSYTLTVAKADPVSSDISFDSETATATYGDATVTPPTLNNPHQLPLTWSSSKTNVATVNASGAITIVGAGETVISAAFAGNDEYQAKTISFALTVNKATPSVTFASKTENVKMGDSFKGQTATTTPSGLTLKYTSSATSVATVNESTGVVTLVAVGSATIKATFAGNDNYNAAEDSYTLTVSKADAVEVELSFSSDKVTATYGDGTVTAPNLNNPSQLPLTWSSSNVNVATIGNNNIIQIVGAGQTVISAAFAGDDTYQAKTVSFTLTVNKATVTVEFDTESETATLGEPFTSPKATITPRDLQLVYSSSDKYIAKVEGNTGEVTLRGVGTVKITATYKGSDNYESAFASYELTVLEGTPQTPTLGPLVKELDYSMDEDYFVNADGSEVDLSNTIINNILFTLKNQNSPEGDGYDTEEQCIVINTVTLTSTLNTLLANGVEPGSADYASQFTGLTFLVAAGDGYIIVTSQEAEGSNLMVKVGANEPVAIHMEEMGDYDIPYMSDETTYVYIWKEGSDMSSDTRTRGKKSALDVKIRGVSHKSKGHSGIQQVVYDTTNDQYWYDLSGQRIVKPVKKGVYIHGNRKVVIR